jgi:hypothetical protein
MKKRVFGEIDNSKSIMAMQKKILKKEMNIQIYAQFKKKLHEFGNEVTLGVKSDNQVLDSILANYSIQYLGTDPVKDTIKLSRDHQLKLQSSKFNKGGDRVKSKDLFDAYGHGIQSYLKVLKILITCFSVISVLCLPIVVIYSTGDGYINPKFLEKLSLGNIGEAKTVCFHQFIGVTKSLDHKCAIGTISTLKNSGVVRQG